MKYTFKLIKKIDYTSILMHKKVLFNISFNEWKYCSAL